MSIVRITSTRSGPSGLRRRSVPLVLALAVAVSPALAGCASEGSDPGADSSVEASPPSSAATSGSATPSGPPAGPPSGTPSAEATLVDLVSISAADGSVTTTPTAVTTEPERTAYVGALAGRARTPLTRAITGATAPAGTRLTATVVDVSCTPPTDVTITAPEGAQSDTWTVAPVLDAASKDDQVQCLVPVTTVALVALPA